MQIKTFGCKLNHYDSLIIQQSLKKLPAFVTKNIVILNSCAVTAQAGKEIRKTATKIKKSQPNSYIVVTGCGAQVETELYKNSSSVDLVVGNSDKNNLKTILQNFGPLQKNNFTAKQVTSGQASNSAKQVTSGQASNSAKQVTLGQASTLNAGQVPQEQNNKVFKSNIFKIPFVYSDYLCPDPDRTRAFLKIQDGCDSFCTFCIIPYARGRSRSLSPEFLSQSIRKLEDQNVKEVVLTGVHIGDYKYNNINLQGLVSYLLKTTSIPRIRLSSLEPIEITDPLLDCYQDKRLCPHFHISLQSASSAVLKSMKRKYTKQDIEKAFLKINKALPHAFIGMDLIVGFPTETEKHFTQTHHFLKNHYWTNIHVFPYSARKGTFSATRYPNLPQKQINQRASLIRKLSDTRFKNLIKKQIGTKKQVLLFKKDNQKGLSRDYWKIKTPPSSKTGEQKVLISAIDKDPTYLKATWLS